MPRGSRLNGRLPDSNSGSVSGEAAPRWFSSLPPLWPWAVSSPPEICLSLREGPTWMPPGQLKPKGRIPAETAPMILWHFPPYSFTVETDMPGLTLIHSSYDEIRGERMCICSIVTEMCPISSLETPPRWIRGGQLTVIFQTSLHSMPGGLSCVVEHHYYRCLER